MFRGAKHCYLNARQDDEAWRLHGQPASRGAGAPKPPWLRRCIQWLLVDFVNICVLGSPVLPLLTAWFSPIASPRSPCQPVKMLGCWPSGKLQPFTSRGTYHLLHDPRTVSDVVRIWGIFGFQRRLSFFLAIASWPAQHSCPPFP